MVLNIIECEVDKDIENLKLFDLIIFYKSDIYAQNTLTILKSFSNHFPNLKIGCYALDVFEDSLLNQTNSYIFLSANNDDLERLYQSNDNICLFSNKANLPLKRNLSLIGFQRHLVDLVDIYNLETNLNFAYSLGLANYEEEVIEAELRSNSINLINFNVVKKFSFGVEDSQATGMELEKLIQLMRFSTNSEHYKGTIFYSTNFDTQKNDLSLFTAECIWYIIEGLAHGPEIFHSHDDRTLSFLKDSEYEVEFVCNENGKYWIKTEDNKEVACTRKEYEDALNGELSKRLQLKFGI
jgi:hypothetical protein